MSRKIAVYRRLAELVSWQAVGEWADKKDREIDQLVKNNLPSGSGWDIGTTIDMDRSSSDKLVFTGGYHHMNEHGYYDGWTEHTVTIRPSLANGFTMAISGRNRNDIKKYLHQLFDYALREEIDIG